MKRNKEINSPRVPVYRDAGFELFDAETTAKAFHEETANRHVPDLYIYSRYRNPTVVDAEKEIMRQEGSEWALLTQSGMSAIDVAVSIFQNGKNTRPWLFFSEIYGGTISFADSVLVKRRGLDIHSFNPVNERYNLISFEEALIKLKPQLVYIESVSNPMLIVPDAAEIIEITHRYDAKIIVDNTFATPYLWKPLSEGADLVIHSATKYFSGHGNITAGVICGNDDTLMKSAIEYRKYVGHMISADDAYRLNTQIRTLDLRFSRQCLNASLIAELMSKSDKVGRVWYPGLKTHPTHKEAKKLFGNLGYGAMVTIDFAGKSKESRRKLRNAFIKAVSEKIRIIPSLGDPHTMMLPVESVWGSKYPEPGMIRISAGFEDTEELRDTLISALKSI